MIMNRGLGKLTPKGSALLLCDMQEKFRNIISYGPAVIKVVQRMLTFADQLEIPVLVTEHYPKGLGNTMKELNVSKYKIFTKTQFSMLVPDVEKHLQSLSVKSAVICGIESHACVLQTVLDLIEKRYEVHVVVDAVTSRSMVDRMYSLKRMSEAGAFLTTSESLFFLWCRDALHPKFKVLQKVIMTPAPDSGLLSRLPYFPQKE
ncbi:hypothetical protein HELRODRAFT_185291 [Helobdella robusta]|uniref:Isochorismatase-like domain-containing protein n=1 Tax=Helobdella robusta TaxID=6412 RepID=T1FMM2_HELRO|nr:hypothetical protein HELRODRAFT_185291 [Helobdella robusta]ESO10888.1 hypothetical protein HELRODRAFT_185291 [Helobdella robusta]